MDRAQLKKSTNIQYGSIQEPFTSEKLMNNIKISRSEQINRDRCLANSGGNHFEMVILVSNRAREIASKDQRSGNVSHGHVVTALLELQEGLIGTEYLRNSNKT